MEDKVKMCVIDKVVRVVGLYPFRRSLWKYAFAGDNRDVHAAEFGYKILQEVGKDCSMGEYLLEKGVGLGFGYCSSAVHDYSFPTPFLLVEKVWT